MSTVNSKSLHFYCWFLFLVLFLGGCAGAPKKTEKIESIDVGAVRLRLVPDTDFKEVTRYVSKSIDKQKKKEDVEFVVESKISKVDIEKGRIFLSAKTINKVGEGDLHDFALPEIGEEIIFELDDSARVYSAGSYPVSSIFFVPAISLPDGYVKKGETWSMQAEWVSFGNNAPFELEVTSILKDVIRCGDYQCADVEVSGRAGIIGLNDKKIKFTSRVQGRYLFIIEKGTVLWSLMKSNQELVTTKEVLQIENCFLGRLELPKKLQWGAIQSVSCDPTKKVPEDLKEAIRL